MGFELVGRSWDVEQFREFVKTQDLSWAKGITLHHTGYPDLAMRLNGLTPQHIRNIASYYRDTKGWSAGPHLFVDQDSVLGMSSLERRGVHAISFNRTHIGIEILGNYNAGNDDSKSGRGAECWEMGLKATAILIRESHLQVSSVNFHRDCSRTRKTCPGSTVAKDTVLEKIQGILNTLDGDPDPTDDSDNDRADMNLEEIVSVVQSIEWQLEKLKNLID